MDRGQGSNTIHPKKNYRAGPKPIQIPVPLHPSARWNPDWSIKANSHLMISMRGQCATAKMQRDNYHQGSCGPSLTGPKGNIIILLSPLELESDFISVETPC